MTAGLPLTARAHHIYVQFGNPIDNWLSGGHSVVRVLLVDDSSEVLEALMLMYCSQPNVNVVGKARNNDEALKILKRTGVDLISIDIYMGTYSGFDLCRTVRRTMPHIFITMCSSDTSDVNKRIAESLGAHYFLEKPVKLEQIQELIDIYHRWLSTSA